MAIKNNISKNQGEPQKTGFRWIFIICLIFCELLIYTWVRTESTQAILRVSKAREMNIKTISYNKALSVERDRLKSGERITRIAKTRLNLSASTSNQTIYLAVSLPGKED
ncbi:MAG: cell division protein FtsL [Deltaproteobacteria bacterium]|nr:cell division protein FtsL [Deltaproteobacteria bacterium]